MFKPTHYYYDGYQVIEERNGSDAVTKQYAYANGIDELVRMDKFSASTAIPYYFHTNAIGSVTAITDNDGKLIERVAYDDYGKPSFTDYLTDPQNPAERATSIIGNTTLFQGREYDTETGLYNYRARYFDPQLARFLQTDPVGYQDSMNLYQAFGQNPVNFVDPMGDYFIIPDSDVYKERILRALALGALSNKGKMIFWDIANDPRPITISSGRLYTDLRPMDLIQKSKTVNFMQTYGEVDPKVAFRYWSDDKKVKEINVTISFENLDNYFRVKNRFGYIFENQGNLDKEGITTIYHELEHAKDLFSLDPSLSYSQAIIKVYEGDLGIDSSGKIIEPRKYSPNSRAQLFGEAVFREYKEYNSNKRKREEQIESITDFITSKMLENGIVFIRRR